MGFRFSYSMTVSSPSLEATPPPTAHPLGESQSTCRPCQLRRATIVPRRVARRCRQQLCRSIVAVEKRSFRISMDRSCTQRAVRFGAAGTEDCLRRPLRVLCNRGRPGQRSFPAASSQAPWQRSQQESAPRTSQDMHSPDMARAHRICESSFSFFFHSHRDPLFSTLVAHTDRECRNFAADVGEDMPRTTGIARSTSSRRTAPSRFCMW